MTLGEVKGTVFDVKEAEGRKNTVQATMSTYEGKDQHDKPRYCSWRTYFVGNAFEKALTLKDKDKILITSAKVENNYDKKNEKLYVKVTVFDFELEENEE